MEQYVGVIYALQYHRHITRKRSNLSIALAWLLSILSASLMTALINLQARYSQALLSLAELLYYCALIGQ